MHFVQRSHAVEKNHGRGARRRTGIQQGTYRRTLLDEILAECCVNLVQSLLHLADRSRIHRARVRRRQRELLPFDGRHVPAPLNRMRIDRQDGARQRAAIRRNASRPIVRLNTAVPLALQREMAVCDLHQRRVTRDYKPVAHDVRK